MLIFSSYERIANRRRHFCKATTCNMAALGSMSWQSIGSAARSALPRQGARVARLLEKFGDSLGPRTQSVIKDLLRRYAPPITTPGATRLPRSFGRYAPPSQLWALCTLRAFCPGRLFHVKQCFTVSPVSRCCAGSLLHCFILCFTPQLWARTFTAPRALKLAWLRWPATSTTRQASGWINSTP